MLLTAHRHQARQPRPGALQAEALRLQQRADRGLQVPLDVRRPVRRHRHRSSSPRTIRASPASAASSARPRSTSCRSSSTWCSRATCRWSARARTRSTPRPRTGSMTRRSTAISPAIASSPASPAGRRSTAGAARPTPRRRSSGASSTTSTTSRTGRCCSTSTSWRRRRSRCQDRERVLMSRVAAADGRGRGTAALDRESLRGALLWLMAFAGALRVHRAQPLRGGRAR